MKYYTWHVVFLKIRHVYRASIYRMCTYHTMLRGLFFGFASPLLVQKCVVKDEERLSLNYFSMIVGCL